MAWKSGDVVDVHCREVWAKLDLLPPLSNWEVWLHKVCLRKLNNHRLHGKPNFLCKKYSEAEMEKKNFCFIIIFLWPWSKPRTDVKLLYKLNQPQQLFCLFSQLYLKYRIFKTFFSYAFLKIWIMCTSVASVPVFWAITRIFMAFLRLRKPASVPTCTHYSKVFHQI